MRYSLDAAWLCLSTLELVTTVWIFWLLELFLFFRYWPVFVKARARPPPISGDGPRILCVRLDTLTGSGCPLAAHWQARVNPPGDTRGIRVITIMVCFGLSDSDSDSEPQAGSPSPSH